MKAPFFRADQVGSLLRPPSLLELRRQRGLTGSYDGIAGDAEVERATRDAVAAAVRRQVDEGVFPLVTGELERAIFYGGFFETLAGLEARPALPVPEAFRTGLPSVAALARAGVATRPGVVATAPIRWERPAYGASWALLASCLPRAHGATDADPVDPEWAACCKITIPSPTYQHMQLRPGTAYETPGSGYADDEAYFADLAAAYRAELRSLHAAGCRSVQVDDPNLTFFVMDEFLDGCRADGVDPDALLDTYVRAHNACLAGRPADLRVGVHLCRGNMWSGAVDGEGGEEEDQEGGKGGAGGGGGGGGVGRGSYERVAERLFGGLDYDAFYLEYDDGRSGDFAPLRFVPAGKVVVLGLVSTKRAALEDPEVLVARVREAAGVMAAAQGRSVEEVMATSLAVSPQCGFASQSQGGGAGMTEERQWEKLRLVRDVARRLWKDAH